MDIKVLLGIAHIFGVAIAVGGATVSDVFFLRILKRRKLTKIDFENLKVFSRIIWTGITILILSGIGFLWRMYAVSGSLGILQSDKFLTKLTLVALVTINGFVFKYVVFPKLKEAVGGGGLKDLVGLLSTTGAISISAWYSIVVLSMLGRDIKLSYLTWLGMYAVVLLSAIIGARFVMNKLLSKD